MEKEGAMEMDVIDTAIFTRHGKHLTGIVRGTLDEGVLIVVLVADDTFLLLGNRLHSGRKIYGIYISLMYGYYIL